MWIKEAVQVFGLIFHKCLSISDTQPLEHLIKVEAACFLSLFFFFSSKLQLMQIQFLITHQPQFNQHVASQLPS